MHRITVTVDAKRRASAPHGAFVIADNNDWVVEFEIDPDSGFNASADMTAVLVTARGKLPDITFSAGQITGPRLIESDGCLLYIGISQGDIKTTGWACVRIQQSIYTMAHGHIAPDADNPQDYDALPAAEKVNESDEIIIHKTTDGGRERATIAQILAAAESVGADAVRYNPQTLTAAQKTQARENIDALGPTGNANGLTVQRNATYFFDDIPDETPITLREFVNRVSGYYYKINDKYEKPASGIPAADLAPGVIPTVPTKVSDLANDSGFVNASGAAAAAPVQSVNGQTGAVTVSVPVAGSSAPAMDGAASAGESAAYARADHVHPSDASKQNILTAGENVNIENDVVSVDLSSLAVHSINLFDKTKAESGAVLNTAGGTQSNDSYWTSDYIPVAPGAEYVFYYAYCQQPTEYQRAAFYDSDKTLIGSTLEKGSSPYRNLNGYYYSHTAPEGAAYLRLCGPNSLLNYTVVAQRTSPTYYDECKLYPLNEFRLTDVEDILMGGTRRMWESGGVSNTDGTLSINRNRARFARAMSFPFTITLGSDYRLATVAYYDRTTGAFVRGDTYSGQTVTTFTSDGTYAVKLAVRTTPSELPIIPDDDIIASATGLAEYVLGLSASINNAVPGFYALTSLPPASSAKFALTPLPTGLLWSDGNVWRRADNNSIALAGNSYITIDTNGNRIAGYNEDQDSVVWSMTKLLTAVVVVETLGDQELSAAQDKYTVNATDAGNTTEATDANTSGSLMYGDSAHPEDLLKASLIYSDNVAADCLARNVGIVLAQADGVTSPTDAQANTYFTNAMSAKATALGLTRTYHFSNHHGQMRSTASDMAKLIKYIYTTTGNTETALALQHIRDIWGQASYTITVTYGSPATTREVTNGSTTTEAIRALIPEFVGGKTGSDTSKGAYGIVWEATDNETKYISVVLDSTLSGRFYDMRRALDEVYSIHARSLTTAPNQPEANVVTAEYGVTTYTRVRNELLAGNVVVTRTADDIYVANVTNYGAVGVSPDIVFYSVGGDKQIVLTSASGWAAPSSRPTPPSASSTTPVMDGTAAVGSSTTYARADHVHPSDTAKADIVERILVDDDGAVTQELAPNKFYMFTGDLTSLTLTLGTPIDGIANIYQVFFKNGLTPVTLTLPASVDIGDFVPEAEKISELNIQLVEIGNIKNYCIARGDNR